MDFPISLDTQPRIHCISHAVAPCAFIEKAPAVVVLLKTSANGASSRFWMTPRALPLASSRPKSAGFNYIPSRERASEHAASGAQTGGKDVWLGCWDRHRVNRSQRTATRFSPASAPPLASHPISPWRPLLSLSPHRRPTTRESRTSNMLMVHRRRQHLLSARSARLRCHRHPLLHHPLPHPRRQRRSAWH